MSHDTMPMESMIGPLCRELKLPSVTRDAARLAREAQRQGKDHLSFLVQLFEIEVHDRRERRSLRRTREARFPIAKTLESFDFSRAPQMPEARLRKLTDGDYIDRAEAVILVGEPGTGKTHLATALGMAAAQQGRRVRFVTAGRLVNELIEARDALDLSRVIGRFSRYEVLILDELGYLPLSRTDADLLFQVLSERQELRSTIVTTNLPFGEWTSVFPDPRLCRAVIDRLTFNAHIIETGTTSVRLAEALKRQETNSVLED